uniref:Pyruvate kinase n=1 Tax=Desulfobacca acetoxidans TaxID=60893 RepID=A0A7C5EMB1_9BACT
MAKLTELRRTKIVGTLGPASDGPLLPELVAAGLDVARLNFSHGTLAEHEARLKKVREAARAAGRPLAILQDLAGPKLRIGELQPETIQLLPGQTYTLTSRPIVGHQEGCGVSAPEVIAATPVGARVLLGDGALELKVVAKSPDFLTCEVLNGGALRSHQGIHLPGVPLPISPLTPKDREDLAFGLAHEVDFVALSFVRQAADILEVKELIRNHGADTMVIAKIEKQEAVDRIEEILQVADGIMVARGDLGVETPLKLVPLVQKQLIIAANRVGKPVITATQMLASMVSNPRPTRAEASDVANAILDGTDAVMLSEETAIGRYPVEAVRFLDEISRTVESRIPFGEWLQNRHKFVTDAISDAISYAACEMAWNLKAKVILASTASGATARLISRFRPPVPVIAVTGNLRTKRRLCLSWGVYPLYLEGMESVDQMLEVVKLLAVRQGFLSSGDRLVITAGTPLGARGTTNLLLADVVP